jgi:hypothetical protein
MNKSINAWLSNRQHLIERRKQLEALKATSANVTTWHDPKKTDTPVYDVAKLDQKVTELNNAIMDIDEKVKESNFLTKLEIAIDYAELMKPIQV